MRAAYVGILTPGTTSRLRAEALRRQTPDWTWAWVDTDGPMQAGTRPGRTLAFRAKAGPVVGRINRLVAEWTAGADYDLVWVDKGVFLHAATVAALRRRARRLVHFTPDTAFHANRSRHFERGAGRYDLLVTTKSFELGAYGRLVGAERVLLTTQGYDAGLHVAPPDDAARRREAVFVGLAEPDRERCLGHLLDAGVPVRLAGKGWGAFVRARERDPNLIFEGEGVFGEAYARLLGSAWVGLGFLSKRFPELHTTRTFEIPACGAILATEKTAETARFFGPSEALFFDDYADLAGALGPLLRDAGLAELAARARAGRARVLADGRDYDALLARILADPRLQP